MTEPCLVKVPRTRAPASGGDCPALASLPEAAADHEFQAPVESLLGAIVTLFKARAATVRLVESAGRQLRLIGRVGPGEPADRLSTPYACPACPGNSGHRDDICYCLAQSAGELQAFAVQLRHRGENCGLLTLYFPAGVAFPRESMPLLHSVSDVLGLALENARLAAENSRLAETHLYASLMQERQLLANEVHDSLAQNIACLRMRATLLRGALEQDDGERAASYLAEVEESLSVAHGRVRELITQFRTAMDPGGLLQALQKEMAGMNGLGGVELSFESRLASLELPAEQEIQVLHIVREALANVVKHAGARHGRVTLSEQGDDYVIAIEDDGVGLAASAAGGHSEHGHFGLNIMRQRAGHLGGEFRIDSDPAAGTRIFLTFPAPRHEIRP
ncbi:MAG: sensor histidine kinase [Bacteroidota bacterium]